MKILFILLLLPFLSNAQTFEAENYATQGGTGIYDCSEGGKCVGSIDNGDWLEYTLPAGTYKIDLRVASIYGSSVLIGAKSVRIPNTGGWQVWQTVSDTITTTSKTRFTSTGQGWNINWFKLSPIGVNPNPPLPFLNIYITANDVNKMIDSALNTLDSVQVIEKTFSGQSNLDTLNAPFNNQYIYLLVLKGYSFPNQCRAIKIVSIENNNGNYRVASNVNIVPFAGITGASWDVVITGNKPIVRVISPSGINCTLSKYNLSH